MCRPRYLRLLLDYLRRNQWFRHCNRGSVCGGGAFNSTLMGALEATLPEATVATTEALGLGLAGSRPVHLRLAKQRLEDEPGNVTAVTGALRETVLGAVYYLTSRLSTYISTCTKAQKVSLKLFVKQSL